MRLQNIDEKYAIYGMLFSLSNRIQTLGDKEFKDITLKQQFLMNGLRMFQEPPTLKEMGDLIGCSYQNVKRMAEQLQKTNYLTIEIDLKDKRKLLLKSTGKYDQLESESWEVIQKFMNRLFDGINRDSMKVVLQTLMKMDSNIGGLIE